MTFQKWLNDYYATQTKHYSRLGQSFVNDLSEIYGVEMDWSELFYCEDDQKSIALIVDFLCEMCLYPDMPPKMYH